MAWVKLDDGFADHPKIEKAGPMAAWLHVTALCYAARQLTDGHIPAAKARRLIATRGVQKLIDRLVEVGLWHQDGDDYVIHDYLDYNPSAADEIARRDKDRKRKAKGRNRQDRNPKTGQMSARNPTGQDTDNPEPVRTESARNPQNVTPVPYPYPYPSSDLQGYNTTTGVPDVPDPPGGGGGSSAETRAAQALGIAADRAVETGNPERPDAYRASIVRRMTTDGTLDELTRLATQQPDLDPTELAHTATHPGRPDTEPAPTHPAIHATTTRTNCPDCAGGMTLDNTGTAHPCPTCQPQTA